MRKTNAELADFFDIKVGDIIEFESHGHTYKVKFVSLDEKGNELVCLEKENEGLGFHLSHLIDADYKVIQMPKHVGEQVCGSFLKCVDCPLAMLLNCGGCRLGVNASLYQCLDKAFEKEKNTLFSSYLQGLQTTFRCRDLK